MCMTIVGKLVKVEGERGIAEVDGQKREVNLGLVDVKEGDYVSCSLNLAVEKLDTREAEAILNARKDVSEQRG